MSIRGVGPAIPPRHLGGLAEIRAQDRGGRRGRYIYGTPHGTSFERQKRTNRTTLRPIFHHVRFRLLFPGSKHHKRGGISWQGQASSRVCFCPAWYSKYRNSTGYRTLPGPTFKGRLLRKKKSVGAEKDDVTGVGKIHLIGSCPKTCRGVLAPSSLRSDRGPNSVQGGVRYIAICGSARPSLCLYFFLFFFCGVERARPASQARAPTDVWTPLENRRCAKNINNNAPADHRVPANT